MASTRGRKRRVTDDDLVKIWEAYQAGGYGAVDKLTGFTRSYVRALVARARLIAEGSAPKVQGEKPSSVTVTRSIGRFIAECQRVALNGKSGSVSLGALPGFPSHTSDPKILEKAIGHYQARLASPITTIQEIKIRQRIMDLRAAMERLSYEPADDRDRAIFMAWGAAWARENGISYGAFREMGLSAEVLREAGITRGA